MIDIQIVFLSGGGGGGILGIPVTILVKLAIEAWSSAIS